MACCTVGVACHTVVAEMVVEEWWWWEWRGVAKATHEVRAVGDMSKAGNVRDVRATILYLIYGWQCS